MGTLIDPQWVVTAAGCFAETVPVAGPPPKPTTATIGRGNLTGTDGHVVRGLDLLPHPDRNIVLARLDTPVTEIVPLALGSAPPAAGETLRATGYGRTATEWIPDQRRTALFTVASTSGTTLALTSTSGTDTCKGDAGGPVLREAGGRVELVAINSTSWQHGCLGVTETRQGSTGTRTDNVADWIRQNGTVPITAESPLVMVAVGGVLAAYTVRGDGNLWGTNQVRSVAPGIPGNR